MFKKHIKKIKLLLGLAKLCQNSLGFGSPSPDSHQATIHFAVVHRKSAKLITLNISFYS